VLLAAPFAASSARVAFAVEERVWLSLEAGADLYDSEQALRDAPAFGLRAAGFLNQWVGVEGLYHRASPGQEPTSLGDATFTHYGGGLILTPQRSGWTLPYLYGGVGSVKVERDLYGSESNGAFHGGLGAVFRAGERIGIRLDARDVSYKQTNGPGRRTRVNDFQISGGVTAFWLGRPRDTDTDGVPNKNDRCPETPKGAIVDAGGCPLDQDADKVFDGLDKCAGTPAGAVVDAGGCPIDTDGDGVFDGIDKCNDTMKGILVDAQGCSRDTDGDQVFDGPDKCPDTPKGARVDAAGCPIDADGDGVPDGVDSCPFTPAGTPVNAGGCPIAQSPLERDLFDDWIIRLTDIEFVTDSVKMTPGSLARADSVASLLAQWPMLKFEVGVHSDNLGEDARRQPLSHLRARYILQHIYSKYPSLNAKNYYYTGYGDTQPLGSNKTPGGRARNRRVEFRLVNMDALTKERERRLSLGTTPVPPAPGITPRAPGESMEPAPAPPPESSAPAAPSAPSGTPAPAGVSPAGATEPAPTSAPTAPGGSAPGGGTQTAPGGSTGTEGSSKAPAGRIPPAPIPPDSLPPAPSPPDSMPPPPPPTPAPPDSN
jgi:outer membrane protein OmpA-like peptidoglycan-associated protein